MTGADLLFDAASHTYKTPAGVVVPSVTRILRATGVSRDFGALGGVSRKLKGDIELKGTLGDAVHQDAHAYDDDDLVMDSVHPDVLPYLNAWIAFRQNKRLHPLVRERRLFHPELGYCGTMDGLFACSTKVIEVDIKTGDPVSSAGQYRSMAYQVAYLRENPGAVIHERWCVWLQPDLKVPYRIYPYTDWQDEMRWRAIVETYYCGEPARRTL